MPSPIWVKREKPPGVVRVVLLGESAAAGFPHPEFSLARLVQAIWAERYPEQRIEVVNLTMVGVNSHILRLFAREATSLQPDAVVLYAGHNEAIGPFGPAQVFGRSYAWLGWVRLNLWLRNTRIGRAVDAGHRSLLESRGQLLPRWVGLEEFRDRPISPGDPRVDRMARQAEANFRAVVTEYTRRGIPILVCQPAVNLTDWPPLGSLPPSLEDSDALAVWRRGDEQALTSAWQAYRLARQRAQAGDLAEAWALYRRASDTDLYRFSADRRIRQALAVLAGAAPTNRVQVVDADRFLHEDNPDFRSDRDYFYEHVHLTFTGRARVAGLLVDGLARLLGRPATDAARTLAVDEVARQVLFTPWDDYNSWQNIWSLLSLGVFARQPERPEREAFLTARIFEVRSQYEQSWDMQRLEAAYREARAAQPEDPVVDFVAGRLFLEGQAYQPAENALRKGLERWPAYPEAWLNLARLLLIRADYEGVEQALGQADRFAPQHPRIPVMRGTLYARTGRLIEARTWLERAVRDQPRHHNALVNLGNVYLLLGDEGAAMTTFARCLEIEPRDAYVLDGYARLLASSDRASPAQRKQAAGYARQAVALRPGEARYRGTLAVALAAAGQLTEARSVALEALELARTAGDETTRTNLMAELDRWPTNPAP